MEFVKPELTNKQQLCNTLFLYLKNQKRPCTKEELCEVLGLEFSASNERKIRDLISMLAQRKPILSTSNQKGYKLALTVEDLSEVEHQYNELVSRCQELVKRMQPLMSFSERYKAVE